MLLCFIIITNNFIISFNFFFIEYLKLFIVSYQPKNKKILRFSAFDLMSSCINNNIHINRDKTQSTVIFY